VVVIAIALGGLALHVLHLAHDAPLLRRGLVLVVDGEIPST
jgi:hypothetical protein